MLLIYVKRNDYNYSKFDFIAKLIIMKNKSSDIHSIVSKKYKYGARMVNVN